MCIHACMCLCVYSARGALGAEGGVSVHSSMPEVFRNLVHPTYGPPQLRRSSVAIDTLQYSCVVGANHKICRTV